MSPITIQYAAAIKALEQARFDRNVTANIIATECAADDSVPLQDGILARWRKLDAECVALYKEANRLGAML
jgi:hypothetical protein